MTPEAPRRFGPYELLGELGRGGMGVVFRARNVNLDREVALKVMTGGADPFEVERFVREARAAARVQHPGVVPVLDAGEVGGRRYLAMQLVLGETLAARLRVRGRLAPAEAAHVAAGVGRALAAAHAQGVLHRDLKPSNVLFGADGAPRLADFGLARVAGDQRLTATGEVVGTPAYMSPEQASGLPVDARTDVYQLGATLYEMLAGRPPYEGARPLDVMLSVVGGPPAPVESRRPDLDPALAAIVARAMARDAGERHASVALLVADLEAWLDGATGARPAPRRGRGAPILVGVGALGLAVAAGVVALRGDPAGAPRDDEGNPLLGVAPAPLPARPTRPPRTPRPLERPAWADLPPGARVTVDALLSPATQTFAAPHLMRLAEAAVAVAPGSGKALFLRALARVQLATALPPDEREQAFVVALEDLEACETRAEPWRGFELWNLRGQLRQRAQRHADATDDLQRAHDVRPDDVEVAYALGLAARGCGRAGLAVKVLGELDARGWGRGDPGFHFNYAGALNMTGRGEEALRQYDLAIEADPDFIWPPVRKGEVLIGLRRLDEAEALLAESERRFGHIEAIVTNVMRGRAIIRAMQGRHGEAVELARAAFAREPHPGTADTLIGSLFELGQDGEAWRLLDEAVARFPMDEALRRRARERRR